MSVMVRSTSLNSLTIMHWGPSTKYEMTMTEMRTAKGAFEAVACTILLGMKESKMSTTT